MERRNHRGQCAVEVIGILGLLTAMILLGQSFAPIARGIFKESILSRELKK